MCWVGKTEYSILWSWRPTFQASLSFLQPQHSEYVGKAGFPISERWLFYHSVLTPGPSSAHSWLISPHGHSWGQNWHQGSSYQLREVVGSLGRTLDVTLVWSLLLILSLGKKTTSFEYSVHSTYYARNITQIVYLILMRIHDNFIY